MKTLRKTHFWVGFFGIIIFILSGQYMFWILNVGNLDGVHRMIYRSTHIYLLFGSAVNLVIGVYFIPTSNLSRWIWLSHILIVVSPFLLLYGFIIEAAVGNIDRPVTAMGLIFIFIAVSIIGIKETWGKFNPKNKFGDEIS